MKNIRLTAVALLCACVAFAFVGCGQKGPKKVSISGTIMVDGEPVDKGSVRFKPADGQGPTDGATIVDGKFEAGKSVGWTLPVFETAWFKYYNRYLDKYGLNAEDKAGQRAKTDAIFNQYVNSLRECTLEQRDAIRELMGSRKRMEAKQAVTTDGSEHQKVWDWDNMLKLRNEGDAMASVPEKMGENMQLALWDELTPEQKSLGEIPEISYGSNHVPGLEFISKIPLVKDVAAPSLSI